MASPSPFDIGRNIGNNFGASFAKVKDENAIEQILSQAVSSGDPAVLQQSIGKILSQVSPERQGAALKYLENAYSNVQKNQELERQQKQETDAAKEAGYTPFAPATVQTQQVKNKAKNDRLNQFGLTGAVGLDNPTTAAVPSPEVNPNVIPQQPAQSGQLSPIRQAPASIFKRLSDDQLVVATGAEDKEISEPAKAELKRRDEEKKLIQSRESDVFKADLNRSNKVIDRADTIAQEIPKKKTALNLMNDAVANRNLSFFSPDNLAEITGIEGLRSQEGAIFKTAGKEYFLGNIARAGARPNQWIEQQIADMMAKIGRSPEANFSVLRALENELDLDEATVRFTNEISDKLRADGDLSQGKLGSLVNKEMSQYAEKKQDVLFNDLRAIKAIAEKLPQKFRKVEKGTLVSDFMAQALLQQFNNDPKKAAEEAKKLGYEF